LTAGAAFPGINPWYGANHMLSPVGRSVYNALQISLKHRATNLLPFLPGANFQLSYSLSRFNSMVGDQDFITNTNDNRNPSNFFGPTSFDRTHQFSFGTTFTFPQALQLSFVGHFASPLPTTLRLENQERPGEIFLTDVNGDGNFGAGQFGDILPGTNIGSFMRGVKPEDLASVISQYNSTQAGTLTPAGQALVSAGLFTPEQLTAIGAVKDTVAAPIAGFVGNDWFRSLDAKITFPIKIRERFVVAPNVSFFNILNFANFGGAPGNTLAGELNGTPGSVGSTLYSEQGNRVGLGSGVFQGGAPRQIEYGLRISF
jgi:hypothetical protein